MAAFVNVNKNVSSMFFRNNRLFRSIEGLQRLRQLSSTTVSFHQWDLISAVCMERLPKITKDLTELEQKFQTLQSTIEFETSLKSNHELRKEQDKVSAEILKKGGELSDTELEQASKSTAQDFEDAWQDEFSKFIPAARVNTEDQNLASVNRKLDQHLLFITKTNLGKDSHWLLPQEIRKEGETMRQAAERAIHSACGENVKAQILGNAPCGFFKYKYPSEVRQKGGAQGAKIFFFQALYKAGNMKDNKNIKWLTKSEAASTLPKEYFRSVDQFLIHD